MRITKVGHKEGTTTIKAEEDRGGDLVKTEISSDAKPVPEFFEKFAELGKYMASLMTFPDEWRKNAKPLWLSVGHETDEEGRYERINAVVTISIKLDKFNNGITVNSPVLREKIQGVPGGGSFMPPKMCELVKEVMALGEKYMDGERAQQDFLPRAERGSKKGEKPMTKEEKNDAKNKALNDAINSK